MKHDLSEENFKDFVNTKNEEDTLRVRYCYHLGTAFLALHLMEDSIISAMTMCDRVKIQNKLGADAEKWKLLLDKKSTLESSTLGRMIKILSGHGVSEGDMNYLKWIKDKRDLFVHRLFRDGGWPGDLTADECMFVIRRLGYFEITFQRAGRRIWDVLSRADLLIIHDLGESGRLMMNIDIFSDDE
jgi:hypothetical protein